MEGAYSVLYNFKSQMADRSVFDLIFDGVELQVRIQDHSKPQGFFVLVFGWVSYFEFESKEAIAAVSNFPSEALVELDGSDYINARKHRAGQYFDESARRFGLYLLDIGNLYVIGRSAEVSRE